MSVPMRLMLLFVLFFVICELPTQARTHPVSTSTDGASASDERFSFAAVAGKQYAVQATGSEIYTFIESARSPLLSAIQLPTASDDAARYSLSFLTRAGFSTPVKKSPGAKVTAPVGTTGLKVTLLDENGTRIANPGDFAFYLSFAASGNVTAQVTGNEPPIPSTYNPTTLPPGGNPPIGNPSPSPQP
jgi:hypothetical protein